MANSACIVLWRPMMFSKRKRSFSCARNSAFSRCSRRCSSTSAAPATSCDSWNGLIRKSTAPRLIARDGFVDATEAGRSRRADVGIAGQGFVEHVHAIGIGEPKVDDEAVVGKSAQPLDGIRGIGGLCGRKAVGFQAGNDGLTEVEVVSTTRMDGKARWLIRSLTSSYRRIVGGPTYPTELPREKASELVNDC